VYQRRGDGVSVKERNIHLDNRFVVPYNKWLLRKYYAHINIEICNSVSAVKYLYKYVYKGYNKAIVAFQQNNLATYVSGVVMPIDKVSQLRMLGMFLQLKHAGEFTISHYMDNIQTQFDYQFILKINNILILKILIVFLNW
jgi:hypothetical protein